MPEWLQIVIAVAVALVALMAGISLGRRRRSDQLREQFGPEYDRTVADQGDRKHAESELSERRRRRKELDIRPLTAQERDRFGEDWRVTQLRFVDDPNSAAGEADRLVADAMRARGYPVEDFEQRAADISVDHPTVVENYRSGHAIAVLHTHGEASTEDLRQAMVHYRALFAELLQTDTGSAQPDGPVRGDHPTDHPTERGTDPASIEPGRRGGRAANGDPDGKRTEVT